MSKPTLEVAQAAPLKQKWTIHPYSTIQPRVVSGPNSFTYSRIMIGIETANGKNILLGGVEFQTPSTGYPHLENLKVQRQVAKAMLCLPDLLKAAEDVIAATDATTIQTALTIMRRNHALAKLRHVVNRTKRPLAVPTKLKDC